MNKEIAAKIKRLKQDNKGYPAHLVDVPKEFWPLTWKADPRLEYVRVLRSSKFLVQIIVEHPSENVRMSVSRTMIDHQGNWKADISWEELQQVKYEAGWGEFICVEIYPANANVVNVANMRHLWLLPEGTQMGWVKA